MAVMLPGEVSYLLNMLGFEWPEGNEDRVFDFAGDWMSFAGAIGQETSVADQAGGHVLEHNSGPAMDAFRASLDRPEGPLEVAGKLAQASNVVGGCLLFMGGLIIALKIAFVVNLVALAIQIAQAVAAAAVTFGASLAWIPIAREICRRLIEFAINLMVEKLMAG